MYQKNQNKANKRNEQRKISFYVKKDPIVRKESQVQNTEVQNKVVVFVFI